MSKPSDLVQGTLDLLLLKIVALEPMNGWSISLRLRQISGDVLQVSDGSLYPALHKLEQEGWISAEWRPSENNRRAKFYSLTRPGRKQLDKEAAHWDRREHGRLLCGRRHSSEATSLHGRWGPGDGVGDQCSDREHRQHSQPAELP